MINEFCNELNKYLQENYSYKNPPAYCNYSTTITARRAKFDLYFRYNYMNENILVIARLGFKTQRKGHGTKLLKFISEIANKHNIKEIYLESVNDIAYEFGKKNGFTDMKYKNMMISSEDLISRFKNK